MKKVWKSIVSGLLSVTLSVSLWTAAVIPIYAIEDQRHDTTVLILDPRYENISRIACTLSISSKGVASFGGSFTIHKENDTRLTLVLQQYISGRWVNITKELVEDYTGSGIKGFSDTLDVESGYRYRAVATAEIFNGDGEVIETVSCDSNFYI